MSVTKCEACGHYVDKIVDRCPRCGEPAKQNSSRYVGAIGLLILVCVVAASVISNKDPLTEAPPKITADCTLQAGRKEFIQKMVEEGYWMQVDRPGALFRVNVLPKFIDSTTLDDKKGLISAVSAYDFCQGGEGVLTVVDAMNGNELGHFDELGLHWEQ